MRPCPTSSDPNELVGTGRSRVSWVIPTFSNFKTCLRQHRCHLAPPMVLIREMRWGRGNLNGSSTAASIRSEKNAPCGLLLFPPRGTPEFSGSLGSCGPLDIVFSMQEWPPLACVFLTLAQVPSSENHSVPSFGTTVVASSGLRGEI